MNWPATSDHKMNSADSSNQIDDESATRRRKMSSNNNSGHNQLARRCPTRARGRRFVKYLVALSGCIALLVGQSICEASSSQHNHNNKEPTHQHQLHQAETEQKQQQQQQSIISSLLANEQQNGSGGVNLIPVDQPVRILAASPNKAAEDLSSASPSVVESRQSQQATASEFEQVDSAASPFSNEQQEAARVYQQADQAADVGATQFGDAARGEDHAALNEISKQQHHQFQVSGGGGDLQEQPFGTAAAGIERRFGLFKNKLGAFGHYGAPQMSANYAYMSDACERCLTSMSQQQQSADLQEAPPPPQVQPQPIPVPLPMPMPVMPQQPVNQQPIGYGGHQQHPLKSKLFMKFPFFMKPSMFGGGGGGGAGDYGGGHTTSISAAPNYSLGNSLPLIDYGNGQPYWPQQNQQQLYHQPTRPSTAFYLRPTSAYNCIQSTPPIYAAASSNLQHQAVEQQTINISPIGQSKSAKSPAASIKQQPFQQQTSY